MTPDEIRQLEQQAADHYQAGDYQKAKDVWKQVLVADPGNEKAEEGIRMAGLLSDNWDFFAEEGGEDEAVVRAALDQVGTLAAEGQHHDALTMLQDLARDYPDNEEIQRVGQEVARAYEAAPFIAEQLQAAEAARGQGHDEEAAAACHKILALDPAHRVARSLLEEIEFGAGTAAAAPGPSADNPAPMEASPETPPPAPLEATEDEALESAVDAALNAAVPDPVELVAEQAPAAASEMAAPAPGAPEAAHPMSASVDTPQPTDTYNEPPPPPPPVEGDHELPMLDLVEAAEDDEIPADAPVEAAAHDLDLDLDLEMPGDDAASADPQDGVPEPEAAARRVSLLVEEGHRALDESRYDEAIDRLSRALAIDQSHEGAATLLEKARRAQMDAHQVVEAKIIEASDLIDSGRLGEAEALAGQVLAQAPDNPVAQELLDRVVAARQAPAATPEAAPAADEVSAEDQLDGLVAGDHEVVPLGVAHPENPADGLPDMPPAGEMPAPPAIAPGRAAPGDVPARVKRKPRGLLIAALLLVVVGLGATGFVFRERLLALVGYGAAANEPADAQPAVTTTAVETTPVEAEPAPEPVETPGPAPTPAPDNRAEFNALLDRARDQLRAGRGQEALALLQEAEDLVPDTAEVRAMRPPARWSITARQSFESADFAGALRSLYRLSYEADTNVRPRNIGRWLDNARWNYLLQSLQEAEPYTALDRAQRELQVRGEERAKVEPLLNVARKWMYETPAVLRGDAYKADVAGFSLRPLDG